MLIEVRRTSDGFLFQEGADYTIGGDGILSLTENSRMKVGEHISISSSPLVMAEESNNRSARRRALRLARKADKRGS